MNENSFAGSPVGGGASPGAAPRPAPARRRGRRRRSGDPAIPVKLPRPGLLPRRPPDRLSQPSTLSLKKSVRTMRFDVIPPCEWPASQNAFTFSLPICATTVSTMLCRYSSSASDQTVRRRVRRGDHQPVLVLVVHQREIVPLPVAVRAGAVQREDERHLLARLHVARVVEEVGPPRLHLDDVAFVDDAIRRTVLVGTVQPRRRRRTARRRSGTDPARARIPATREQHEREPT